MAKRHSEETLHDPAPKRHRSFLHSLDMKVGSVAAGGGVPSLLALLGSRCRKRPHYFGDVQEPLEKEDALYFRTATSESRSRGANVLTEPTNSRAFHEPRSCCTVMNKKRPREEYTAAHTPAAHNKAGGATNGEDPAFNSFQFWKNPLPELDLSLLDDPSDQSQTKEKSKVASASPDSMET